MRDLNLVICTYSRAQSLEKTLASVEAMELPRNKSVAVIVVDNNSSDHTRQVVESHRGGRLPIDYVFEPKQGKSQALNTALEHVDAAAVAFTDDDILATPGYLRAILAALDRYPAQRCFGGQVRAVFPDKMPAWLDLDGSMQFVRSVFVDRDDGDTEGYYGEVTPSSLPGGCNMFFRREAVEQNGPFRTDLGPQGRALGFAEDTEYCSRFLQRGERFLYIPGALVYHPLHEDRLTKGYLVAWQYACGRSEARRSDGVEGTARLFGVPRYLFRKYAHHLMWRWLCRSEKARVYHRLRLAYTAGQIAGYRGNWPD